MKKSFIYIFILWVAAGACAGKGSVSPHRIASGKEIDGTDDRPGSVASQPDSDYGGVTLGTADSSTVPNTTTDVLESPEADAVTEAPVSACPIRVLLSVAKPPVVIENYSKGSAELFTCLDVDFKVQLQNLGSCEQELAGWHVGNLVARTPSGGPPIVLSHTSRFAPGGAILNYPVPVKLNGGNQKSFNVRVHKCIESHSTAVGSHQVLFGEALAVTYRILPYAEVKKRATKEKMNRQDYTEMLNREDTWEGAFLSTPLTIHPKRLVLAERRNDQTPELYFEWDRIKYWPGKPIVSQDKKRLALMVRDDRGMVFRVVDLTTNRDKISTRIPIENNTPITAQNIQTVAKLNRVLQGSHWTPLQESGYLTHTVEDNTEQRVAFGGLVVLFKGHRLTVQNSSGQPLFRKWFPHWVIGPYCGQSSRPDGKCILSCINRPYLSGIAVDADHTALVVHVSHTGNDTCVEPEMITHVVPLGHPLKGTPQKYPKK